MARDVGVARDAAGLRRALAGIARLERAAAPRSRAFLNVAEAATLIAAGALSRAESRGAHARTDFPQTDAAPRPTRLTLAAARAIRAEAAV